MKSTSPLLLLGIGLMCGAGSRLSTHLGMTGFDAVWFAAFAFGILLIAREPVRRLSDRVRQLETQAGAASH